MKKREEENLVLVGTCRPENANVSRHLDAVGRVNLGSFYTPARYVRLVGDWLLTHGVGNGWTVADLSCGYGAFFALGEIDGLRDCRYVGNDIDAAAVAQAKFCFPNVEMSVENDVIALAKAAHPDIFGVSEKTDAKAEERIQEYVQKSLRGRK